ncbi:hypothetical protein B0A48_18700 [Cryoendolithus antarcticus]|uniref:BZIP domain-containing protein n=1 Tax=Cryoendolithus antarcticus TaxID=1507870 RepID=A0A1V8S766_9PEZI|nr:hypothetical protein B0A48_18872 [Cryoendolithus antarcticus]OQN95129.1 hypothetical protein B0A48_18873 [Cryoendolithus antarcticus]OQN95141.1 hypothetical protein B0A48_18726 [Cryoendolithus antarcticus]OQN95325.1 hypothetical protein B0A48_18700 [Cryoendolithus antarcticus]
MISDKQRQDQNRRAQRRFRANQKRKQEEITSMNTQLQVANRDLLRRLAALETQGMEQQDEESEEASLQIESTFLTRPGNVEQVIHMGRNEQVYEPLDTEANLYSEISNPQESILHATSAIQVPQQSDNMDKIVLDPIEANDRHIPPEATTSPYTAALADCFGTSSSLYGATEFAATEYIAQDQRDSLALPETMSSNAIASLISGPSFEFDPGYRFQSITLDAMQLSLIAEHKENAARLFQEAATYREYSMQTALSQHAAYPFNP